MTRTADRPIPSGRVSPAAALRFGILLVTASVVLLGGAVNWLAAGLSFCGFVGYVGIYTIWLKRRTPPLVGWAAATGHLSWTPVLLFAIVFYWTPPHFWALSLLMKDEYAKVNVPMLPVVRGEGETRRQILIYTFLLYAVTQLPFCAGKLGGVYLACSMVLGGAFIYCSVRLYRLATRRAALQLYLFSLAYLALLFGAMVLDARL